MIKQKKSIMFALFMLIFYQVILTSMWQEEYTNKIWKLVGYAIYGVLLFLIIYQVIKFHSLVEKQIALYLVVCGLIFFIYMYKGFLDIAIAFLVCASVVFINTSDLFKCYFLGISGGMVVVFLLAALSVLSNYNKRWIFSFGFKNPNTLGFYIILIFLMVLYLVDKKMNVLATAAFVLILFFLKIELHDVTAMMILFVGYFCYVFSGFGKKLLKFSIVKWTITVVPLILTVVTYWVGLNYYNYSWMYKLNNIFTSRPIIWNYYLNSYPLRMTGTVIPKDLRVSRGAFDGAYLYFPMIKGLLPFAFILILAIFALYKTTKNNEYFLTVILVLMLVFAFSENTPFIVHQSPLIPLVALLATSRSSKDTPLGRREVV